MSRTSLILCSLLTIVLAIFFLAYSQLDLKVANYFYISAHNFTVSHYRWAKLMRVWEDIFIYIFLLSALMGILLKLIFPMRKLKLKFLIYIIVIFALIPGLMINTVFKDHFHRPRPREVTQFSGTLQFKPAWVISDECPTNCSFVCGDAAVVFAFWAFLPFFRRRWKFSYGTGVLLLGALYGYIRIGQGAHFLSDVIFAALLTYIGVWFVYWFFYRYCPKWLKEESLEHSFSRARASIKKMFGRT